MENLNSFINYSGIFNDVVKTHLESYPKVEVFNFKIIKKQ